MSEYVEDVDNGRICPACGKKIIDKRIKAFGINQVIQQKCECEIKKIRDAEAAEAERKKEERKRLRFERSGMTPKLLKHTFDNFEIRSGTERAYEITKEYADRFPNVKSGIFLIGGTGSGKTHLACAIGNALLERGYTVKFVNADDLYKSVLNTYKSDTESEESITRPYKKCSLLIIDDVGTNPPTEKSKSVLHSVIETRMNNERPTIMTSNLKVSELTDRMDSRTIDRIPEAFKTFVLTADSYRQKGGKS